MAKTDTPQPASEPTTDTNEPAPKAKVATPALEAAAAGMTTADVIAAHEANMPAPADPVQSFLASLELRIAELEQIVADVQPVLAEIKPLAGFFAKLFSHFGHKL